MKIILGSSSPRRKLILENLIKYFDVIKPDADETPLDSENPVEFSERASREKAQSIAIGNIIPDTSLIISCDTIVTIDNLIIGKPDNFEDAEKKIALLNGRTHEVISSITLLYINNGKKSLLTDSEKTAVTFENLSDTGIKEYLNKIEFMDKAGAYAIQEHGDSIIQSIKGSLSNVIGFPVRLFLRMSIKMNIFNNIFN